jgi:hypothetical protein
MAKAPRKKTLNPPRSQWETTLEDTETTDRSQAGEIEAGDEERGGGDKGIDAETGDGGYGGDAVEAGHDEAAAQTDRPIDREIQGDPRTHEGENYPSSAKVSDPRQRAPGDQTTEDEAEDE